MDHIAPRPDPDAPRGLDAAPHVLFVVNPDEPARALEAGLRAAGYRVTAGEFEDLLEDSLAPVDLLVTDHDLAGRSGLEVASWVRRAHPGARALVLTALRPPVGASLPAPFCPRRPKLDDLLARVTALTSPVGQEEQGRAA